MGLQVFDISGSRDFSYDVIVFQGFGNKAAYKLLSDHSDPELVGICKASFIQSFPNINLLRKG